MSDSETTADRWLEAQKRYWDAWTDMARRGLDATIPGSREPANPWADAMEQWWKAVSPAAPKPAQDVFSQLVNLGKNYFAMAEGISKPAASGDVSEMVQNWMRMLSDAFGKTGQGMNPLAAMGLGGGKSSRDAMAFWDLPFDTWSRTMSAGSPVPGDFLKAFESDVPAGMRTQMDRFLSAPAVGYGREYQEQYQKFARLVMEYERAMSQYQAGFGELGQKSLETFQKHLEATAAASGPVNSVRQVYNLWVDACEEVYAEYAMSDSYAKRYGEMVNALMAVKHQGARLVDEWLEAMNMPTRSEISGLQRRVHDSRNDYRKLSCEAEGMRAELEGLAGVVSGMETLRQELDALRETVKKLQEKPAPATRSEATGPESAAPAKPAATKTPAKPAAPKTRAAAKPASKRTPAATAGTPRKTGTTRRKTQS
jgi:class III poly(R)-hydroxyalkanoic acid synthase PhaE subunit